MAKVDDAMAKALADYAGPITRCRAGKAKGLVKPTRGSVYGRSDAAQWAKREYWASVKQGKGPPCTAKPVDVADASSQISLGRKIRKEGRRQRRALLKMAQAKTDSTL